MGYTARCLLISLTILLVNCDDTSDYQTYLQQHPYYTDLTTPQNMNDEGGGADLAYKRDFIMTMDPSLGHPTQERLKKAYNQLTSQKNQITTSKVSINWKERGPQRIGGRTRALMWDPNDPNTKKVWAGGVTGGLWYNNDITSATSKWQIVDNFWPSISVSCITYDPQNPQIFYLGTGEGWNVSASRGAGIWKSTDAGITWTQLESTTEYYYVNDIEVRIENGLSVVYAGISSNNYKGFSPSVKSSGLQRSQDGGITWKQVLPNVPGGTSSYVASDIELGEDNTLWIGTIRNKNQKGGATILSSENGIEWTTSYIGPEGSRVELATARSNTNRIYAIIEANKAVKEMITSNDHGTTWNKTNLPVDADPSFPVSDFSKGQAWYDLILQVDPNDENTLYAGTIDLFRTTDAGNTWQQLSHWSAQFGYKYLHGDQHEILFRPNFSKEVIIGNDGGVYLVSNMNEISPTFTKRNLNYNVTQFYTTSVHQTEGKHYYLSGSQDNGVQQFTAPGFGTTKEILSGDGSFSFIDPYTGHVQLSAYTYNTYYLSRDAGATFNQIFRDQTSGTFINTAAYDYHLGVLYAYKNSTEIARYYNINQGIPYRSDTELAVGGMITAMRYSPYSENSSIIYIGTALGKLFKIDSAHIQPIKTEITGGQFPSGSISCIEIGKDNDELMAIFSNYGVISIWYSADGGESWQNKEGDLPDMPVRWGVFYPGNNKIVILATELGVWYTSNFQEEAPHWIAINDGLANVRVDMLRFRSSDKHLAAATYGRGLFTSDDFIQFDSAKLGAHFSTSTNQINVDQTITFTNKSTGNPTSWKWYFDGGTPEISTDQNPVIKYEQSGIFKVKLTVASEFSQDSIISEELIKVLPLSPTPNLRGYNPPTWADYISLSSRLNDFSNTSRISNKTPAYLSYVTMNDGNAPVSKPYISTVYIDNPPYYDSLYQKISAVYDPSTNLGAGKYRYVFFQSIKNLTPGSHVLHITLDHYDSIKEITESDNRLEYEFYVQSACGTVNSLSERNGTISDESGSDEYMPSLNCQWFISPKNMTALIVNFEEFDLGANDTLYFESLEEVIKLYGSEVPESMKMTGDHISIRFSTDDEGSGQGWKLSYIAEVKLPDLIAKNLQVSESNGNLNVVFSFSNEGNLNMSSPCNVRYFWSEDEKIDSSDEVIKTLMDVQLNAGASTNHTFSVKQSSLDRKGNYLIAHIDFEELVEESNEENNYLFKAHKLIILSHQKDQITIFPNPADDQFTISGAKGTIKYSLKNLFGATIKEGNERHISTHELANGLYQLEVKNQHQKILLKLLIKH